MCTRSKYLRLACVARTFHTKEKHRVSNSFGTTARLIRQGEMSVEENETSGRLRTGEKKRS